MTVLECQGSYIKMQNNKLKIYSCICDTVWIKYMWYTSGGDNKNKAEEICPNI